jgi:phosphate butyryltransferase
MQTPRLSNRTNILSKGHFMFKNFTQLIDLVKSEKSKTIAVAMAEDNDVLIALENARSHDLAQAILVGDLKKIKELLEALHINQDHYQFLQASSEREAVRKAVNLVKSDEAQVLMKGICSTANFLKGILDKNDGLRSGKVISHLAIFESPHYHKLFMMSDAAMNIAPDISTKIAITENALEAAIRLGYKEPKIAIISALEKVNPEGIPSSADAAIIAKMGERGQIKNAVIDGPLAVDNALSAESCRIKGLKTPLAGDADICIVPNIETGNVFYKLLTIMGGAKVAGVVLGAKKPVVLTSRADSDESKFLSIVTALKAS